MKTIVITGSTRGIGYEMARSFLNAGCQVTLSGRGQSLSEDTLANLKNFQGSFTYIKCNVQDPQSLQALWDGSVKEWGKVDIWINNAGQNTPSAFAWETDDQATSAVVHTNILGMIYGSQIAAKEMLIQGHGAIYSMEGLGSNDMIQKKTILYGTTKRALTYFMKGLSKELEGTGIVAGRLSPGMMLTDFITKEPDGGPSKAIEEDRFRAIFNTLGDRPETVASFFIPRILKNTHNDAHIVWLTNRKILWRFTLGKFKKRTLLD